MKHIVDQLVKKALADIKLRANPPKLTPEQARIQLAFDGNTALQQPWIADLVNAITGYRPQLASPGVVPFQVFWCGGSVKKFALAMITANATTYGCPRPRDSAIAYDATSELASPEKAEQFIKTEVASWEDSAVIEFVVNKLGYQHAGSFMRSLE